ncbi:twin-arginine translocation signal domain-containing protein, partial [Enterobacter hormaechei]
MPIDLSLSRRKLLKTSAGAAALGLIGAPAISHAQAEAIKIGHI